MIRICAARFREKARSFRSKHRATLQCTPYKAFYNASWSSCCCMPQHTDFQFFRKFRNFRNLPRKLPLSSSEVFSWIFNGDN